ncbi:pectin lyase fold/virulence factor [Mycena metata]|uniref:Pectinesterase n=1 Tax=Mycena metata TaxID=1033252 RepID=A0AAD7JZG5_9AGAR|nr:pectin lyase fold/virulence factor [Mycena metata]
MLPKRTLTLLGFCAGVYSLARTTPPTGAVVVRGSGTQAGEFSTVQAAVTSLPADGSAQTIFIYPGTYIEQVHITRVGKLAILGSTTDIMNHAANSVRLSFNLSQGTSGGGDLSATLRIDTANVSVYNMDIVNTFGPHTAANAQALAVAGYGTNLGFYAVGFYGYQDTLRAEKGVQFYGLCYIEGAVDFIFGQNGHAFFHKNTIASVAAGAITADGPDTAAESLFVINQSNITTSAAATSSLAGQVFLGRPWSAQAQVAYISCTLGSSINPAGWEIWSVATPQTSGVLFAEFDSTGPGAAGQRAPFSTKLSSATGFGIADVLGSTWATWVDSTYFI